MRAALGAACLLLLCLASVGEAELIANWNFNSYDGDAHTIAADRSFAPGASIEIDSTWPSTELAAQTGTTLNAFGGDPAGDGIEFLNSANNGEGFTMQFSMNGWYDPVLSFAYKRPGNGFDDVDLFYSTDNVAFTKFADVVNTSADYQVRTFDLASVDALDDLSTAYLRLVLNGAANQSGTADFDNIQINAIPEPASFAMMGLGGCVVVAFRARRRERRQAAP